MGGRAPPAGRRRLGQGEVTPGRSQARRQPAALGCPRAPLLRAQRLHPRRLRGKPPRGGHRRDRPRRRGHAGHRRRPGLLRDRLPRLDGSRSAPRSHLHPGRPRSPSPAIPWSGRDGCWGRWGRARPAGWPAASARCPSGSKGTVCSSRCRCRGRWSRPRWPRWPGCLRRNGPGWCGCPCATCCSRRARRRPWPGPHPDFAALAGRPLGGDSALRPLRALRSRPVSSLRRWACRRGPGHGQRRRGPGGGAGLLRGEGGELTVDQGDEVGAPSRIEVVWGGGMVAVGGGVRRDEVRVLER